MKNFFNKKEKGLSLVETLVAIAIFGIGIAGFTMLFFQSWTSHSFILEEGAAATQATQAVRITASLLRQIRQSDAGEYMIKTANDNELTVYVNDDDDEAVERVHYWLDDANNLLKKGIAEAGGAPLAYPADYDADTVSTIATYVMNSGITDPVFKYYDNENDQLSSPYTPTNIKVIEINLWVNIKPLTAPENVRIGTSVEIRNLDESI